MCSQNENKRVNLLLEFGKMRSKSGEELNDRTIIGYVNRIKRVMGILGKKIEGDIVELCDLVDYDNVIKRIEEADIKNKDIYYIVILRLLNHLDDVNYREICDKYYYPMYLKHRALTEEVVNDNLAREDLAHKYMKAGDIIERIRGYNVVSGKGLILERELLYKVITSFYFLNSSNYIPRGEIRLLKVVGNKEELKEDENYVILNSKGKASHIILNRYKTYKTYGQQRIRISEELKGVINLYLESVSHNVGDYLIMNKSRKEYNESNFSALVSTSFLNVVGKGITTDMARHIQVSEFNSKLPSMNMRKKFARICLNSVDNANYYIKLDI